MILNENPAGAHSDVYHSLNTLKDQGFLEDFHIYPFLSRLADGLKDKEVTQEIVNIAKEFLPSAVLWSHTGRLIVSKDDIYKIRNLSSHPSVGYWDGDIYHKFYKPLPKQVLNLMRGCDVAFWPGRFGEIKRLKNKTWEDIRYVPLSTDERFMHSSRKKDIKYDVVMVGNYITSKIYFKTFPGSRYRKKIADYLYEKLGDKFAAYGNCWKTPYAKGSIPFEEQYKAWQSGRISVGINNLHADYYFSNRLPISLSSSVIMVHNYEPGIDKIFKRINYSYFFRNKEELWEKIKLLLSKPQKELDKQVEVYRKYVINNISMYKNLSFMIDVLEDYHKNRKCGIPIRQNPWTKDYEP